MITLVMENKRTKWQKMLPYILLICGTLGLIASFALTYDKIHVLQDPSYRPGCNLNPVLSCGSVMKTTQASLFGMPNTLFGIAAFSMTILLGACLVAGATFKRWLWICIQLAATTGVIFMHYLFFESVFRIHAICPWCFMVWMITILLFASITVYNIRMNHFGASRHGTFAKIIGFVDRHSVDLLVLWYLIIAIILLKQFWYYWRTLV